MGFIDFFRPKWKHGDPDVRAAAVGDLDDDALLAKIARDDGDARVRKIALKKIRDADVLGHLAVDDPDDGLRKAAAERQTEILVAAAVADGDEAAALAALARLTNLRGVAEVARRAASRTVRQRAVAGLADPKALADVARHADDAGVRRDAVLRITDQALLRDLALREGEKAVGLAAVEKLDEGDALDAVAKKAKNKAVRAAAAEKLAAVRRPMADRMVTAEVSPAARRRARKVQLCVTVEAAAKSFDWDKAAAEIEKARAAWAELGTHEGEEELGPRFDKACELFRKRHEESKRHADELGLPDREALERERERERQRAAEARARDEEREKQRAEEKAHADAERAKRDEERARRDEERAKAEQARAAEREKREAERKANAEALAKLIDATEQAASTDDHKAAERALKRAQEAELGPLPRDEEDQLKARFQAARQKLVIRVQELRESEDWKRWTNVPRLEALCARVEGLLEATDLKQAARDLRAAQAEWKEVGPAPRDKSEALWTRFKTAADQVYARCQVYWKQLDEERGANLTKKEELCARVETLAAAPDDKIDWKETAELVKALQEEWKAIGPVPKEQTDAIWKRFREACDKFFGRRKEHFGKLDEERNENLARQEALCARVEAMAATADDKIDWKRTADAIKVAQAEWKTIGPAPKDKADAVWKRFRAACDQFFDRRKAHFATLDAERAANLEKKEALCKRAEEQADAGAEDPIGAVKALMAEWKAVGPAPREQADAVWERFRAACDRLRSGGGPEPEPAAPAAAPVESSSKFENRLPLAEFLEKMARHDDEKKPDAPSEGAKGEP